MNGLGDQLLPDTTLTCNQNRQPAVSVELLNYYSNILNGIAFAKEHICFNLSGSSILASKRVASNHTGCTLLVWAQPNGVAR